jgi:hypothetical protein
MVPSYVQKQISDMNQRFQRLVRQLGNDNSQGTDRHSFETDFAYSLREIELAPQYIVQKFVDRSGYVIDDLIKHINAKTVAA